ncbi:MAG: hypothetical protein KBC81_03985 [Candidatus Pacebacteria bacterium]|nr:hypothetical protein [Candidatus Paceibacterota bacterium]
MDILRQLDKKRALLYGTTALGLASIGLCLGTSLAISINRALNTTWYLDYELGACSVFAVNMPDKTESDDSFGSIDGMVDLRCKLPANKGIAWEYEHNIADNSRIYSEIYDNP